MKVDLLIHEDVANRPSIVVVRTTVPIFRFSGEYFGFLYNNSFFDATSNYLGWLDDAGFVWHAGGIFLGKLVDNNYILKPKASIDPAPRSIPPVPASPLPPFPESTRVQRLLPFDCRDALDCF